MQTWWSHSGHVGEGKRTFTSFSQGTRTKKMEESGRKGRGKKIEPLIARCSRYFESVVLLSWYFSWSLPTGLDIFPLAEIRGFVAKRKEESRLVSHFHYGQALLIIWPVLQVKKWESCLRSWQETTYSSLINDFTETLLRSVNKRGK